ncbi:Uncharacterized protein APZ42_019157 [Daphnia magna]|uniref:Uncharacterized protein n=1 Tax=Daphnia magna TaxID=35525 RepID=A0A164YJ24_9CRUS|nr:Uncharacterized protein APZ42_019157 [Daphnia magna]
MQNGRTPSLEEYSYFFRGGGGIEMGVLLLNETLKICKSRHSTCALTFSGVSLLKRSLLNLGGNARKFLF